MSFIHLNIGSNINKELQINKALSALKKQFKQLVISSVYESAAVGFEGDNFYNVGVNLKSDLSIAQLNELLHNIEDNQGRNRNSAKFSARTIDLDLVLYDEVVDADNHLPRADILKYSFVLAPLVELCAQQKHPVLGHSYQTLWQQQTQKQPLLIKHPLTILGTNL